MTDELEDRRLVKRLLAHDREAFTAFFDGYFPRLYRFARTRLGDDPDTTKEIVQVTLTKAMRKLSSYRGEAAFSTWLHRLAVNVVLGRREERGRRRSRFSDDETFLEVAPARRATPEESMDLESAMARLPAGAREVFVLHDVEGYRHEEIADMLGLATGTSKSQLHRARMALRAWLD